MTQMNVKTNRSRTRTQGTSKAQKVAKLQHLNMIISLNSIAKRGLVKAQWICFWHNPGLPFPRIFVLPRSQQQQNMSKATISNCTIIKFRAWQLTENSFRLLSSSSAVTKQIVGIIRKQMKWQMTVVETMNSVLDVLVLDLLMSASLFMKPLNTRASATMVSAIKVDHNFQDGGMFCLSFLSARMSPHLKNTYEMPRIDNIRKKVTTFILVFCRDSSPMFSQIISQRIGALVTYIYGVNIPTFLATSSHIPIEYFLYTVFLSAILLNKTMARGTVLLIMSSHLCDQTIDLARSFDSLVLFFGGKAQSFKAKQLIILDLYQSLQIPVFLKNNTSLISIPGSSYRIALLSQFQVHSGLMFLKNRAQLLMSTIIFLLWLETTNETIFPITRIRNTTDLRMNSIASFPQSQIRIRWARSKLLMIHTPNAFTQ